MSSFLNLPSELLARTFAYANQPTLKALRQTCRHTSSLSTDQLYRTVRLKPDEASQNSLRGILNSPSLREIPRKIYMDTVDDGFEYGIQELQPWPEGWNDLVPQLKGFRQLNSAVLCFPRDFIAENEEYSHSDDDAQPAKFRFRAMGMFFSLLESLQCPIQHLGMQNLQVDNPKDQEILKSMSNVLTGLRSLRLGIVSESNEAAPEHDLELPEIRQFFQELPSTWLSPTMASLEHLSLFARDYFGFYPHLDLSNLYFPRLMTLSLGNFCFFHDRQIDWILKHGDTLEEIYLDDCTILYDFCMMDYNVEHCGLPRSALARRIGDDVSVYGSYGKRWHDIFDLFAEKLPKLRYFRIGSGYWFDGVPFEQEDEIKPGLYYNRYMACYDGFGPSPYMERAPGEDGIEKGWWQKRPECDEEDRAALRRLLGKIGQSIEEIP